jgi:ABC-type transport system involved in multi-copper enzyme maturation permease subunit
MYVRENPVLQRELLVNLRMTRAFVLLFVYVALLGGVVYLAWPQQQRLDLAQPEAAKRLVNLFFFGQYMLASMMAPSFAAGAITGEKERMSYEMLLATPLRPGAIVLGKLFAALCHLAILMICSLPIVMLCLPLGGVSLYEVFVAYFGMISTVGLFGMISLWASSYFKRTSASLVVSYLMILPLAVVCVLVWQQMEQLGGLRLLVVLTVVPVACVSLSALMWHNACRRLLYPPDLGSEGKEVVDLETEAREAVGLYIKRDEFPDKLFAPPKRNTFMDEGTNPIYDKEMRSEIFSQGTLMLRLVIQISMLLALFVMAACLYIAPAYAAWYISYVILFNMLVGPVFSAGSVTSERERQTLDLLLVTLVTPWQMLWGKLLSGLRVSSVLTSFLLWPVLLACVMPLPFWHNLPTMAGYVLVVALTCLTTAVTALFCSSIFQKTATSLISTYLIIVVMFMAPVAVKFFAQTFFRGTSEAAIASKVGVLSPFSATFALPLDVSSAEGSMISSSEAAAAAQAAAADLWIFFGYIGWTILYNGVLILIMMRLFQVRWRVAD